MDKFLFSCLIVCLCKYEGSSLNLPGPLVYVVTPSPRPPQNEARASPFYYHNWMRRMDTPQYTTTTPSPDLIFAEFESGNNMKSIRKLLEREKIAPKTTTTTTSSPIYVPEESNSVSYMSAQAEEKKETKPVDMTDYFALYNNLYNPNSEAHVPAHIPSTTSGTSKVTSTTSTSTTSTTTLSPGPGVENIWQIIDSQKHEQYSGQWEEQSVGDDATTTSAAEPTDDSKTEDPDQGIDENFALPGFATNPVNGAENESRAIRTEQNMRFPYVNLKPFQVKTQKKPVNSISYSKKGSNMFTSLDNFQDIKNPVRGEAQDVVMMRQPIDRYNPAQPYLPDYGSKSKQSGPSSPPKKAVANLVPPPPPPPPKLSDGNFPSPSSYESFPPYAARAPPATPPPPPQLNDGKFPTLTNYEAFPPYVPSGPPASPPPPPPPPAPTPSISYQPPVMSEDSAPDASPGDSDAPMDLGYRYKPPSPPVKPFVPTLPPLTNPSGYSYDKPYGGYFYDKPPMIDDSPPDSDDKPDFQGYHYGKPAASPPKDNPPASYGHGAPSYGPDYPELIYDKHPGDMKGGDDMKDMGMVPPPPDMKPDMDSGSPSDDHGFPHDFPGDLKFHHDFDDHDYHHHHHHTTTTTTTTTEMPRVNRYSYYYLGKKLYYLPLYFSVYFIVYVGALIIKAVLRHKIVYPNSWRPNDQTASFFSKRSVDSWDLSNENLHEMTGKVMHAIAVAGQKYFDQKKKK